MRDIPKELSSFNGGGFSSRFTLNMDVGPTYKEIHLRSNLDNDQLTRITLTLNGDAIVDVTGEELRMLETYKKANIVGWTVPDGLFTIPLADFTNKSQEGQDLSGLVTVPGDNLVLEIRTGAATAQQVTDSLVPTMQADAIMGVAQTKRVLLPRMYSELIPVGATGKNKYRNFPRGPRIRRLHLNGPVTDLELIRDDIIRFERDKVLQDYLLEREGLAPQVGWYHFDPLMYHFGISDMLQTAAAKNFEINPTVSSAGDFSVLFETLESVA
ncbi:MAG: major capsid protein P2 [Spongiibacter sp.]